MNTRQSLTYLWLTIIMVLLLAGKLAADSMTWVVNAPFDDVYAAVRKVVARHKR